MFRVEWRQTALNDLANAWTTSDSTMRRAITNAAREIEDVLKRDPEEGESRPEGRRILFVEPLAAVFRVNSDHELVTIVGVWRFRRPRRPKS